MSCTENRAPALALKGPCAPAVGVGGSRRLLPPGKGRPKRNHEQRGTVHQGTGCVTLCEARNSPGPPFPHL